MFDERSLKSDLAALGLLALTIFLALALLTYNAADPPSSLVYPPRAEVANVCGRAGAWLAHGLFSGLGYGAYYLTLSLGVAAGVVLARGKISEPWIRGLGWLLSLAALASFGAMAMPAWSPGPVVGAGGYLGAAGRGFLESHFASAGAYVLVLSSLCCGLLLCTDYVLVHLSARVLRTPARHVGSRVAGAHRRLREQPRWSLWPRRALTATAAQLDAALGNDEELEDEELEDEEAGPVAIKIRHGLNAAEPTASTGATAQAGAAVVGAANAAPTAVAANVAEDAGPRIRNPNERRVTDRQVVMAAIEAASQHHPDTANYELPPLELLQEGTPISFEEHEKDVRRKARILEKTFRNFGFQVKVVEIDTGPVIAQFEVELEAGLRLSKITSLSEDLAIALRVPSVRIVAPIPGKNTVGIEVPNAERQIVRLREVMEESAASVQKQRIPIYLGKDVSGKPMVVDLTTLPHLLIAGRTGTGKSVCLNTIIMSMLMARRPDEVKMLLIDPKMVELTPYARLPHLMHPVVTDMKKAEAILAWAVDKMEERYALLARAGVRHISLYNQLGEEELRERLQPDTDEDWENIPKNLPFIVIVADEMADLMMTAAKEVESHIIRLAQKSRAVGIHLVLATQKPTVDVITGLIKSNLPARIAFQVASRTDSRVVLDEMGADKLLGNGDLLFLWPGTSTLLRGQGAYVSDEEITSVVGFVGTTEPQFASELVHLPVGGEDGAGGVVGLNRNRDELYTQAIEVVVNEGRGSVSLLQRALGVGYGRAARLIDYMAEDGIVGQYNGSQAREVLISPEKWQEMNQPQAAVAPEPKSRSNRIVMKKGAPLPSASFDDDDYNDEPAAPVIGGTIPQVRASDEIDEDDDDETGDELDENVTDEGEDEADESEASDLADDGDDAVAELEADELDEDAAPQDAANRAQARRLRLSRSIRRRQA